MSRAFESDSSKGMNPSLAVVVPMYNEERGAERCILAISSALRSLGARAVLIVVDDGSTDRTSAILSEFLQKESCLVVLTHEKNRGYGRALQTGARHAAESRYDYVLFMDSDLTNDPGYLPRFLEKMTQGYDVIKASRYTSGGGSVGVPAWRVAVSKVGNRIARSLFRLPLTDFTNGFRAIRTDLYCRLEISETGFPSIMEELYQVKPLTRSFCEVPYTLTARTDAVRRSSFSYGPAVLYRYLKYALRSFLGIPVRPARSRRSP